MIISSTVINHIYYSCLLTSQEKYYDSTTVPGFTGQAHTFHHLRIQKRYIGILSAIKKLPRVMLHSQSPNGVPWILARNHGGIFDGCTLETAERLLVMGIALGIVRVTKTSCDAYDIPYVTIDDDRLIRTELVEKSKKRSRTITRWHR